MQWKPTQETRTSNRGTAIAYSRRARHKRRRHATFGSNSHGRHPGLLVYDAAKHAMFTKKYEIIKKPKSLKVRTVIPRLSTMSFFSFSSFPLAHSTPPLPRPPCLRTRNERSNKVEVVDYDKDESNEEAEKVAAPWLLVLAVANSKRLEKRNDIVLGHRLCAAFRRLELANAK